MKRDSALWVMSFDHTGLTLLEREAGDLFRDAVQVSCEGTYCGRPHLYPLLSRLDPRSGILCFALSHSFCLFLFFVSLNSSMS